MEPYVTDLEVSVRGLGKRSVSSICGLPYLLGENGTVAVGVTWRHEEGILIVFVVPFRSEQSAVRDVLTGIRRRLFAESFQ